MIPEMVREEARVGEVERASRSVDELDRLRDSPPSTGRGGWLVVLLGILGVAALLIFLYLMAIL